MLQRLFAASESPELVPVLSENHVEREGDIWNVRIALRNLSSAVARDVAVFVKVENPEACESIFGVGLHDASDINPGQRVFTVQPESVIHRGLDLAIGSLRLKMKGQRRILRIRVSVLADKMRARIIDGKLSLGKSGVSVQLTGSDYLY